MAALLNAALAIVTAIGFFASVWAFRGSRRTVGAATWWFLIAFSFLALSVVLRGLYWDVFWTLLKHIDSAAADSWSEATGGTRVNVLFGALKAVSISCIFKCRQMLIPEDERAGWPWWKAWMHPTQFRILPWR